MRVLVVGAGRVGAEVLRQLKKNPAITVLTLDPRPMPYAVQEGLIEAVDIREALTPLTMEVVMEQSQADLVLLTTATEDLGLGRVAGMDILAAALRDEIAAICEIPVIQVSRTGV